MTRWGSWLLHAGGKSRAIPIEPPLLGGIGFWNCFGGYYTELFRKMDEKVLKNLAEYFDKQDIPISYFGLDLWYSYGQIGFAKNYEPDEVKYPRGLGAVKQETDLPYLLHMSAFESPNDYVGRHEFAVEKSSSYPMHREFYEALARDFKKSGAIGIWPDFLRTQLQNSKSMRDTLGSADRWFDNLSGAFGDEDIGIMMCMPTIGHYLASTRHQNIIAVRTHTDYMNHQSDQVEALRARGLISNFLPMQRSIRHNVLLSLLAHAVGLRPSFDVFLTNAAHPEGFAEPYAETEALLRALSCGVVAVGDEVGFIDRGIVDKLCFPDGRIPMADHPPLPLVSTLQSAVLAFYTTAMVGASRWVYLALFNVSRETAHYQIDAREIPGAHAQTIYDYFGAKVLQSPVLEGDLDPAQGHYFVIIPETSGFHFLGFPGKYITVSSRQVTKIETDNQGATVNFLLPFAARGADESCIHNPAMESSIAPPSGRKPSQGAQYTVAVYSRARLHVEASGAELEKLMPQGQLLHIDFVATSEEPSLSFRTS